MEGWITQTITSMGYPGIALLMLVENLFPPIPSELIMPAAGFAAARGERGAAGGRGLSLPGVIAAGSIGSLLGQVPLYLLGRWLGRDRVRRLVERRGRWVALSVTDIDRASGWFDRRGGLAVAVGRLVPGVRSLISIAAGVERMNPVSFALCSAAGIAVWTSALALAGHALGSRYERVRSALGPAGWVVLGAVVGLLLLRLVLRWRRSGRVQPRGEGSGARPRMNTDRGDGHGA